VLLPLWSWKTLDAELNSMYVQLKPIAIPRAAAATANPIGFMLDLNN
jgi:hypothetical protein